MIDKAVCNLLIPFVFEKEDWNKIDDYKEVLSQEKIKNLKESSQYDSKEWFSFCFRDLSVKETFQMQGSPLLCREHGALVKRLELNQPIRSRLGLHQKENAIYHLVKDHINFRLGKIRLLFFQFGLGMIHLEIESCSLSTDELLNLSEQLAAIQKDVKFSYENKIAKDSKELVVNSIKKMINNILSVQSYIKLSPYRKETFGKAYSQEYLMGNIDQNMSPYFFEMLRNQRRSNMRSAAGVDFYHLYKPFDYITWISGEKTLICYADLNICGEDNRKFLTEPDGLVKSINLNYVTIYAYLIAVQFLLRDAEVDKKKEIIDLLHELPLKKLSTEAHINELFDAYVNSNLWKLSDRISEIWDQYQRSSFFKDVSEGAGKIDHLVKQVDYIVSFTNTELKSFLDEERRKLKKSENADPEIQVGEFINHTATYIDGKVGLSGDGIVKKKREGLRKLFGERWQYLLDSSQTSLVSAATLLERCADINTPDFDFSGICICATAALEAELKRIFFDGLLDYMVEHYGTPETDDANEIYKYWPDALLTVPKFQYVKRTNLKVKKVDHFTMGNLPFLFGKTGKLSDVPAIQKSQLEQAEMMKARMSEYLSTIILDYYKDIPYETFYLEKRREDCLTYQSGCFVWKCERIRENYRNKAAHVNVMSEEEASSCYQSIITKPDTYIYNAEIAGTILELFCKIDGSKLKKKPYDIL